MAAKDSVPEVKETKEQRFKRTACEKVENKVGFSDAAALRGQNDKFWEVLGVKCRYKAGNVIPVLVSMGIASLSAKPA